MHIVKHRYLYFILPALLVLASLVAIFTLGLKPGVDLRGGALLEVSYTPERPSIESVEGAVTQLGFGEVRIQPTGEYGYFFRLREITPEEKLTLIDAVALGNDVTEERFTSIGSTIGDELRAKGWVALTCVALSVVLYIAFVFRHVSKPVASWKYGFVAILTLVHDILIPTGLFAVLGATRGAEVDSLFIVAILTILGISINDTIVVFDRIRENLRNNEEKNTKEEFKDVVGRSMDETTARSLNTSLTVVVALVILFVFGPEATRNLALTLMVGMIAGTYSSLFLAAPLLVDLEKLQGPEKKTA
jgi:preprotein translocase subunit SecF